MPDIDRQHPQALGSHECTDVSPNFRFTFGKEGKYCLVMFIKRFFVFCTVISCAVLTVTPSAQATSEPTFVIDPSLTTTEQLDASQIQKAISKAAKEFGHTSFTAVIYAPSSSGANWAFNELNKISCPLGPVESMLYGTAIADVFSGRCIVFKATSISYANVAKDAESVAYHEVFHLAQALRGGQKPPGARFDDMRWMYEGVAEIAGYQPQISSGRSSQNALISLLRDSAMNTSSSLTQISNAWVDNSIVITASPFLRTNAMYARSYLAAYYLSTISSSEKVMNTYFAESSKQGDHVAAFSTTFGMTVSEFDARFSTWISSWTFPVTSKPTSSAAAQKARIGGTCSSLNSKATVGGKRATCKRVAKKLVWVKS